MCDQINSGKGNTFTTKKLNVATILFLPKACGLIGCNCVEEVLLHSALQIFNN